MALLALLATKSPNYWGGSEEHRVQGVEVGSLVYTQVCHRFLTCLFLKTSTTGKILHSKTGPNKHILSPNLLCSQLQYYETELQMLCTIMLYPSEKRFVGQASPSCLHQALRTDIPAVLAQVCAQSRFCLYTECRTEFQGLCSSSGHDTGWQPRIPHLLLCSCHIHCLKYSANMNNKLYCRA